MLLLHTHRRMGMKTFENYIKSEDKFHRIMAVVLAIMIGAMVGWRIIPPSSVLGWVAVPFLAGLGWLALVFFQNIAGCHRVEDFSQSILTATIVVVLTVIMMIIKVAC
jgi:hypothetical protein